MEPAEALAPLTGARMDDDMPMMSPLRLSAARGLVLFLLLAGAPASYGATLLGSESAPGLSQFLPVQQAFVLEYGWQTEQLLQLRWQIAPGYYLYRDQMRLSGEGFELPPLPPGISKVDEYFGEKSVYYDQLLLPLPLKSDAPSSLTLHLSWQGCADAGLCYPPQQRTLQLSRPVYSEGATAGAASPKASEEQGQQAAAAPLLRAAAEDEQLASQLNDGSLWRNLLLFFGFGLLLTFTPCVLPMVPILSGLLAGAHAVSRPRALALSSAYVLAMALTYALAGIAAALSGASLQSALQTSWVLGAFSGLLVFLSLSMFGLYDLQMPVSWQNWLVVKSGNRQGGSLTGAGTMGVLSALIVGPCVAPPLVGALLYISRSGDTVQGGLALFSLGLGMGVPLLIVGTTLGALLPRTGVWMERIKQFFGFALLGLAIWFAERLLSAQWTGLLWALLWLGVTVWLLHGVWSGVRQPGRHFVWLWLHTLAAALALVVFVLILKQAILPPTSDPDFAPRHEVHSLQEFQMVLASEEQPVVLDFYADWCVECKKMELKVFPLPQVREALRGRVLVKADVTANDEGAKALLERYGVIGPPTLLFFDRDDRELRGLRATGYINAEQLVQILSRQGATQ